MRLFIIDENNEVIFNAPWIKLIPEFNNIFKQAKIIKANRPEIGDPITYTRRQFAYIYFMYDFSSPLRSWNETDRAKEALRYTSLITKDVTTETMKKAIEQYNKLLIEACRPLKTYNALLKTVDKMDEYFESLNFDDVDKQGKLKYTPNQAVDNASKMNKFYDELHKLKTRITTELEQNTGIRGKASMGDKEVAFANDKLKGKQEKWDETTGDVPEGPKMVDIHEILNQGIKDETNT